MGLRGPGARGRKPATKASTTPNKKPVWDNPNLSRVERVVAFLEDLPITKGILQGEKMTLLPGQREFVESVYGRVDKEGKRIVRLAIKSEPRGNGKTGLIAGL